MKIVPIINCLTGKAGGYTVRWPVPGGGEALLPLTPEQAAQHALDRLAEAWHLLSQNPAADTGNIRAAIHDLNAIAATWPDEEPAEVAP